MAMSLLELLEKEKWAAHAVNKAYDEIAAWHEAADDHSKEFGESFYHWCMEHVERSQNDFDNAAEELREIRKQIKEHIAMIMAIE